MQDAPDSATGPVAKSTSEEVEWRIMLYQRIYLILTFTDKIKTRHRFLSVVSTFLVRIAVVLRTVKERKKEREKMKQILSSSDPINDLRVLRFILKPIGK